MAITPSLFIRIVSFLAMIYAVPASADTIFRCRSYSGGIFWSSVHCNQKQALVERATAVPSGLPFDQQVAIAQGAEQQSASRQSSASAESERRSNCNAIDAEMARIWQPYGDAQHVPPDQVGIDRRRWLDLEARRNAARCGQ